ncbi:MAG: DUF1269 domain-containing protein [Pseudomonadota bacterium]
MNRMLIVVFDTESAAEQAVRALRELHSAGSITLYAMGVIASDAEGRVSLKAESDQDPIGTGVGLAVGSVIGMLGGPVGVVAGAVIGSLAGAVRDYWVAGVGLDFVEEARSYLKPGKSALVAEVEEEWVTPVNARMEAVGGVVFRRARSEVAEAHLHADISAFRSELKSLDHELAHANALVKDKLHATTTATKLQLESTLHRVQLKVAALAEEADAKLHALKLQLGKAEDDAKAALEERIERVKAAYEDRRQRLSATLSLASQAFIGG